MTEKDKCLRCDGCGRIANSDSGEPWSMWEALPEASKMAVRMGIVQPIECPDCNGMGVIDNDHLAGGGY